MKSTRAKHSLRRGLLFYVYLLFSKIRRVFVNLKTITVSFRKPSMKLAKNPEMLNNFRFLGQVGRKVGNGGLICLYNKMYELSDGLYVLPLGNAIDLH